MHVIINRRTNQLTAVDCFIRQSTLIDRVLTFIYKQAKIKKQTLIIFLKLSVVSYGKFQAMGN